MADDGWYDDGDIVREAERARRVAWIGMSVVTGLLGAVVLVVAAVALAVVLALSYAMAVMD
jgi:type IV secretory pathway component VirB8